MNSNFIYTLKKIFKENLSFLFPGIIFWLLGTIWLIIEGKSQVHLWFDAHKFSLGDIFFKYITYLGDGLFLIALIILLFIIKKVNIALPLLFGYISSTAVVQLIKYSTPNNNRPYLYFYHQQLYRVEGVDLLAGSSFPSGHSAIAFCLFFMLASILRSNWQKIVLGSFAVLICFSRIYLNQHFYSDVIVGGIIGWLGMLLSLGYFENKRNNI